MAVRGKTITATFGGSTSTRTEPITQYDYGQLLTFPDLELPEAYEVHFSCTDTGGVSYTMIGNADGVEVPDVLIQTGSYIYAFIFLHEGEDDGETEYRITIPVRKRPEINPVEPSEVQQDAITQAIAALQSSAETAATNATAAAASATAAAESAEAAAGSATGAAESASGAAESASDAEGYATAAAGSASAAEAAVGTAQGYANAASQSADDAEHYADLAGQAAANAGYMEIDIDENGHLIYTRTDAVDVDFSLDESGHLIMEAV